MTLFNGKMLSMAILIIMLFPFEGTCLEIEDPQELMDGDFFKVQPKRSPRLLTTRFGKRRLITTRFGKRDGGFVGSNLDNTEDNRKKMAFGMDAWQAKNSDRNMDYNASPYKLQNAKQNEFYNTIHRLEY